MPASKAQRAKTAKRRTQAIELRVSGMDWQSIANELGYASRGAAWTDVTRALEANLAEMSQKVDVLREQEALRLDQLQEAVWPHARNGDVRAVEAVLKVIDRRVRLFGLDAPQRADVTLSVPATEEERRAQLLAAAAELARRAASGRVDAEEILAVADEH